MLTQNHISFLEESISSSINIELTIVDASTTSGGSINKAYKLKTNSGIFFVKQNSASRFHEMFAKEVLGLKLLQEKSRFIIPEVIGEFQLDDVSFLVLEHLNQNIPNQKFWFDFGKKLAHLHQQSNSKFGLSFDNYIGSISQTNHHFLSWTEFFENQRLSPLVKLAFDKNLLSKEDLKAFKLLYLKLEEIFPTEKPSLVHGDLWSGNFLCNNNKPVLIDPAVYYGNREMDLAMTRLFGGFDDDFYHAYQNEFPLEKGWVKRIDICNLCPNLVHLILFGRSYYSSIKNVLNAFA
jgi:protein-ribulosamine 3-kinase